MVYKWYKLTWIDKQAAVYPQEGTDNTHLHKQMDTSCTSLQNDNPNLMQCNFNIYLSMHSSSESNILPVNHVGTRLRTCLEQMTVHMKKLLQTLPLSRYAGFKTPWKTGDGARGVHPDSNPLPLLNGTRKALQPGPPSLPGNRYLTAGCLQIHV